MSGVHDVGRLSNGVLEDLDALVERLDARSQDGSKRLELSGQEGSELFHGVELVLDILVRVRDKLLVLPNVRVESQHFAHDVL
jgi:hypothetical protein